MKLVIKVKLLPDREQSIRLRETMERFNKAATFVGEAAFEKQTTNYFEIRRTYYREVRDKFGLSSQQATLAIKSACDAYKKDKQRKVRFRPLAGIPFDARMMGFKGGNRVSLLTLSGRTLVPMVVGNYQDERMPKAKGQCYLVYRNRKWLLFVTIEVSEDAAGNPNDFIGVDFGIEVIAADSDGNTHSGESVEKVRRKHNLQRKRLQKRGTKGAKKKLKRVSGKESRFRNHENHCISKAIVSLAKGTNRGIAIEDLKGIRARITARGGDARNRLSSWSFRQLADFVLYKSQLAGVTLKIVKPAYTSQTCSDCGHCEKSNRKSRTEFQCKACGYKQHADVNAARNIRALAALKPATELATLAG